MSDGLMNRLLDVVEAADFEAPAARDEEFVNVGLGMLSLAISKLAPAEREDVLRVLEGGALRRAVEEFPGAGSLGDQEEPYGCLN
jgi:hypothetical protein